MVAEVGRKRGAAEAGLAPARRIEIDDVKRLFAQQKGHLEYFFSQVRRPGRGWSDATPRGLACRVSKKFSTPTADIARPILLKLSPPVAARFRRARLVLRENHAVQGHHPVHRHRQIGVHRQEGVPDARLHRHAFHVARSRRRASRRHRRPLRGDILVMLSKSGETEELVTLLPYAKAKGAFVVAATDARDSTLGEARRCAFACPATASSPLSTTPPARPHDSRHRPRTPPFRCSSGIPARCI